MRDSDREVTNSRIERLNDFVESGSLRLTVESQGDHGGTAGPQRSSQATSTRTTGHGEKHRSRAFVSFASFR